MARTSSRIVDLLNTQHITDSAGDNMSHWVPHLMNLFMKELVSSNTKRSAICQTIVQAGRPRTAIMPIPLGLAISIDNICGSSQLVTETARLGFCLSYDELMRFKQSVVVAKRVARSKDDTVKLDVDKPLSFTQFVADNVDHDICTLDGTGTFHGMGIISTTVNLADSNDAESVQYLLPRIGRRLTAKDVAVFSGGVPIVPYLSSGRDGLSSVHFRPLVSLHRPLVKPPIGNLFLLQHICTAFESADKVVSWAGFMCDATDGSHATVGHIEMHPLIDLQPSDDTCINSTLLFVDSIAQKLQLPATCVTFDQPLWLKAVNICLTAGLNSVVCRLGGFHLLMSYLGCIGHVMNGSGLQDMFLLNYGPNTVRHMLTGKAYSRSLRGHLLVERALMFLLLELVRTDVADTDFGRVTDRDLTELSRIVERVQTEKVDNESSVLNECSSLAKIDRLLDEQKRKLSSESRTACLWIQYLCWIHLVKQFIMAERTGNWQLHLETTADMLPLFAAAGHHHYAKSARLYLQQMRDLPSTHPWLHTQFTANGYHTVRRTSKYWAGLSTDLLIEQTLMKSLKSPSGLTHGRGLTESVRNIWVHSMHESASRHLALRAVTCPATSEESHTDCGASRASRDSRDFTIVLDWLRQHNPFVVTDGRLRALGSGVTASDADGVTCDIADGVGHSIQMSFDTLRFVDTSIKKKLTVKTLADVVSSGMPGESKLASFDVAGLFHRLILLIERSANVEPYFEYELTATPTSLFKGINMHKAVKPAITREMTKSLSENDQELGLPQDILFVIDGGALLHSVRWPRHISFSDVVDIYVKFLHSRYAQSAVIVFDGYDCGATTKDHEHKRRLTKATKIAPEITFTTETILSDDQQAFLANTVNKARFIEMLSCGLRHQGFTVVQAEADCDTGVVSTALVKASCRQTVAVAADDTDILVMLVHHLQDHMADIHFVSQIRNKTTGQYKQLSVRAIQQAIGEQACRQLVSIHAIGGCDTTSAIFGIGKGTILKRLSAEKQYVTYTDALHDRAATAEEVVSAGLKLMVILYGGKDSDSLHKLRYKLYCKMVAESVLQPRPQKLPPTESAARYHVLRAHLQAVRWSMLSASELDATEWGWKLTDDGMQPILTDQSAAPSDILNIIRCKCKTPCSSALCSCRKNGLYCVTACSNCHGDSCLNVDKSESVENDLDTENEPAGVTSDEMDSVIYLLDDVDWQDVEVIDDFNH